MMHRLIKLSPLITFHLKVKYFSFSLFIKNIGGSREFGKYSNFYTQTLCKYQECFGTPPSNIWPSTDERFGEFGVWRNLYFFYSRKILSPIEKKALNEMNKSIF